jgi:hypothetical protein
MPENASYWCEQPVRVSFTAFLTVERYNQPLSEIAAMPQALITIVRRYGMKSQAYYLAARKLESEAGREMAAAEASKPSKKRRA